jgi:CBS domain-containing protein
MKLSDLLQDEWVAVPIDAQNFGGALSSLEGALEEGPPSGDSGVGLLAAFHEDGNGEVVRVTDAVVLAAASTELVTGLSVTVGLAEEPFVVDTAGTEGTARVLMLVLSPASLARARGTVVPTLTRILRESPRIRELLSKRTAPDPAAFTEALNAELHGRLLVEDAVTPVRFRVYPETPLGAVVDLLVGHGLEKIPVVGASHELLGIITSGDILGELLPRWRTGEGKPTEDIHRRAARDLMQRSVMCVSEEQSLLDAAHLMVNRHVGDLPVVREGVLVGFLEQETVLRTLFMR